jgi:hypothetical protein
VHPVGQFVYAAMMCCHSRENAWLPNQSPLADCLLAAELLECITRSFILFSRIAWVLQAFFDDLSGKDLSFVSAVCNARSR